MLRSGAASLCCYSRSTFDLVTNIVVLPFVHVFGKTGRRTLEEEERAEDYYWGLQHPHPVYNYNCRTAVGRSVVLLENIFREIAHFRIELEFNNTAADTTHHVVQNYFLPFYHIQFR